MPAFNPEGEPCDSAAKNRGSKHLHYAKAVCTSLHSEFLLDKDGVSRNETVAFILHRDILFSIRKEELPVFRLQRLRALIEQDFAANAMDILLDLYAANAEHSAGALEDVYRGLEVVGSHVLSKQVSDENAAKILTDIAQEEDLNGRIRRNAMDTRRVLSFLILGRFLKPSQLEYSQQILRDIDSVDGHTASCFVFGLAGIGWLTLRILRLLTNLGYRDAGSTP